MIEKGEGAAIVMRQYGGPDVLRLEEVPLALLQPDEIRIRSIASAVNHSDLEIRAGNWPILRPDPFPYTPGLEVVGDVVEVGAAVSEVRVADRVMTMMQGLGGVRAQRPGGYATHVVVKVGAVAVFAADIDPLDMAALGLASVTAFEAPAHRRSENRRIAVTGAPAASARSGCHSACRGGAEVIGIISRQSRPSMFARSSRATMVPRNRNGPWRGDDRWCPGYGRGQIVRRMCHGAAAGGVLSLVGAVGGSDVSFDAYRLLEVTLTGYSSETLDGPALRGAIAAISERLKQGVIPLPARALFPLAEAAAAHTELEQHRVQGRVLLVR